MSICSIKLNCVNQGLIVSGVVLRFGVQSYLNGFKLIYDSISVFRGKRYVEVMSIILFVIAMNRLREK